MNNKVKVSIYLDYMLKRKIDKLVYLTGKKQSLLINTLLEKIIDNELKNNEKNEIN